MKFSPAFLDEIRDRLPVSEVVAQRVKLRKQGREWAGLSPFNAEKTPSFFVNDQKGFYHDFSSGKHGDIFRFLMETEGLSFPDAVERLAGLAGVPMPRLTSADVVEEKKRASLIDVLAMAARLFEANLQRPVGARPAAISPTAGSARPCSSGSGSAMPPPDRFALRDALAGRGRRRRSDDRGGAPHPRRGDRRSLRPVPRPGDVPDPRPRRQGRRLRRPGDGAGRQGQVSQLAGDAAFPQGIAAVQPSSGAQEPRTISARSSSSRAISTRSR